MAHVLSSLDVLHLGIPTLTYNHAYLFFALLAVLKWTI